MANCTGCGAQIEWVKTNKGKSMPVNPGYREIEPIQGRVVKRHIVIVTDEGYVRSGIEVPAGEGQERGREPHWATCPAAARFKRGVRV
jgi:hypothetical protein